jgi:hypothetical protein
MVSSVAPTVLGIIAEVQQGLLPQLIKVDGFTNGYCGYGRVLHMVFLKINLGANKRRFNRYVSEPSTTRAFCKRAICLDQYI